MKRMDRFMLYVIACLLAVNNAYRVLYTEFDHTYKTWLGVGFGFIFLGIIAMIVKKKGY